MSSTEPRGLRIAIVGSHATGKSTLAAEVASRVADARVSDEPYWQLHEGGHVFADVPTVDDFELLFDAALAAIAEPSSTAVIFDRSPADYLAYLVALQPETLLVEYIASAETALKSLDLIVYVPIERPDRVEGAEHPRLRQRVDRTLREMLIDPGWGWATPVLEVRGTTSERAAQVIGWIDRG